MHPIYSRDKICPEWEGAPWPMSGAKADMQELGFHQRAVAPIVWRKVESAEFSEGSLFGYAMAWFIEKDVEYYASHGGEQLLLVHNIWFGFPDPPEWGLITRSAKAASNWQHWGHFSALPSAWEVPGQDDTPRMAPR